VRGKLALVNEGINFSMQQLRSGISSFLPVLGLQISGFQDILESHNNNPELSCEDMDNEEELGSNFDTDMSCEDMDNEEEVGSNFDTDSDTDCDNGSIFSNYEFDT
jgi:hypothetical protein